MTHDEEIEEQIRKGEHDENLYEKEGREDLVENAEIEPREEAFMQGYEEGEKVAICQNCGKTLDDDIVEEEFDNQVYRFCSSTCASAYENKRQ